MSAERRYRGGCHCGAVRFTVTAADPLVVDECNCSICRPSAFLHLIVARDAFSLDQGQEALVEYRFGTGVARHLFCGECGVKSFYIPRSHPDGVSVNARCLDDIDLSALDIRPFDGRNWEASVAALRQRVPETP